MGSVQTLHTCRQSRPRRPAPAPRPIPIVQGPPTLARALSPSTSATFQRTGTDWKVESSSRSQAAASRQNSPKSVGGGGARPGSVPLRGALVIGFMSRHSAFRGRGGGGAQARRGEASGGRAARSRVGRAVTGSAHARVGRAQEARGPKSSEALRAVPRHPRGCRSRSSHPLQRPPQSARPAPPASPTP